MQTQALRMRKTQKLQHAIRLLPKVRPWDRKMPVQSVSGVRIDELEAGLREELEHTHSPVMALIIALDHLHENPRYYSKQLGVYFKAKKGQKRRSLVKK